MVKKRNLKAEETKMTTQHEEHQELARMVIIGTSYRTTRRISRIVSNHWPAAHIAGTTSLSSAQQIIGRATTGIAIVFLPTPLAIPAILQLRAIYPNLPLLVVGEQEDDPSDIFEAGADRFLTESSFLYRPRMLVVEIEMLLRLTRRASPEIGTPLGRGLALGADGQSILQRGAPVARLSPIEAHLLRILLRPEGAKSVDISSIMRETGLSNAPNVQSSIARLRQKLVRASGQRGWIIGTRRRRAQGTPTAYRLEIPSG